MEVAPGIHRIETLLGDRLNCLHLLTGDEHALLVDTGLDTTPRESLIPYLETVGLDAGKIRYVVITHADFDHMGGNAAMREIVPNAVFLCHDLDRPMIENIDLMIERRYGEFRADHGIDESDEAKAWIRVSARGVPMDVGLTGGEKIGLGAGWYVEILHTPGHSRGHLSIYDPRSHAMIICDTALWNGLVTKDGTPAFPPTYRYVDTYLASIQRLQGMAIDTLLPSHYPVQSGSAIAEFLSESRSYVERVESALREELVHRASTPPTMRNLIETLNPRLGNWADGTYLVYPLVGHLERLTQYGLIAPDHRNGLVTWRWKG